MNVERPVNKNQATMEDLHAEFLKKYSASNRGLKLASERIVPDPTQKAACLWVQIFEQSQSAITRKKNEKKN